MIGKYLSIIFLGAFISISPFVAPEAVAGQRNPCNPFVDGNNPCNIGAKKANPCNPCTTSGGKHIRKKRITDHRKLVSIGKKLWNNKKLGKSGLSCMSCHSDDQNLNFGVHHGEWPHNVPGMTDDIVTLTQMINICMINPMEGKPIDPNSVEMTAMAAYYLHMVKTHDHHPCDLPCGHPCGPPKEENPCNPFDKQFKGVPPTG